MCDGAREAPFSFSVAPVAAGCCPDLVTLLDRTPVLGIALAALLLVGETVGLRTFASSHRPREVSHEQLRRLERRLDAMEANLQQLRAELVRLRSCP
jgi:hypothetical protein